MNFYNSSRRHRKVDWKPKKNLVEAKKNFGLLVSKLPMTYLGLPAGSTFKEKAVWNSLLEKMEQRLEKNVSLHGRPSDTNKEHII